MSAGEKTWALILGRTGSVDVLDTQIVRIIGPGTTYPTSPESEYSLRCSSAKDEYKHPPAKSIESNSPYKSTHATISLGLRPRFLPAFFEGEVLTTHHII